MWPRVCSYNILAKDVAGFCPCHKKQPQDKLKRFVLIPLAKEISKQPSNDSVVCLLTCTLMNMYNKVEQTKQGKIKKNTI